MHYNIFCCKVKHFCICDAKQAFEESWRWAYKSTDGIHTNAHVCRKFYRKRTLIANQKVNVSYSLKKWIWNGLTSICSTNPMYVCMYDVYLLACYSFDSFRFVLFICLKAITTYLATVHDFIAIMFTFMRSNEKNQFIFLQKVVCDIRTEISAGTP